jgi:hypothetical protein
MPIARPPALLVVLALAASCGRGPSRDDALAAIRAAQPALDGAAVTGRVWQDGPAWFSCAEVRVKLATGVDSATIRDQVGNWKPLVDNGWIVLRDSASGPVADPGWCTARITDAGQPGVARWTISPGPAFPTGQPRRGWTMPVGTRKIVVAATPAANGNDAATAPYLITVATNPDGAAIGADRDTSRFVAELRRVDGRWRVATIRPASSVRGR